MSGPRVGNGPGQGVTHQTEVASYGMNSPSARSAESKYGGKPLESYHAKTQQSILLEIQVSFI